MNDPYQVLPHRSVRTTATGFEHVSCGMPLTERDVKKDNWCPYCLTRINMAAWRRGRVDRVAPGGCWDRLDKDVAEMSQP